MRMFLAALLSMCAVPGQTPAPDPKALLERGIALEKSGQTGAAIRQFQTVIQGAPPPAIAGQARLELVRIYEVRGDWSAAAQQLEALRKLAPEDPEYAYQLGIAYRNLSRWAMVRMKTVAPAAARVKQIEAEQYAITGDAVRAARSYAEAIAADPNLPGSHLGLAMLYARGGKRAEALAEIDKELAIAPESAVAKQIRQSLGGAR